MVHRMKTTLELSDAMLTAAKEQAWREGTSLRAVVERALRRELATVEHVHQFSLDDASVDGGGLRADFDDGDWSALRDVVYEGRGGA